MSNQAPTMFGFTRRTFLARTSALGAASLLGAPLSAAGSRLLRRSAFVWFAPPRYVSLPNT